MTLLDASQAPITSFDTPGRELGPMPVLIGPTAGGVHYVDIGPTRPRSAAGSYRLEWRLPESEEEESAAISLLVAAEHYARDERDFDLLIEDFERAASTDNRWAGWARFFAGYVESELRDRARAREILDWRPEDELLRLMVDTARARIGIYTGDFEQSRTELTSVRTQLEANIAAGHEAYEPALVSVLDFLCVIAVYTLDEQRVAKCDEQLERARALGDPSAIGFANMNGSGVDSTNGDYTQALAHLAEAIPAFLRADRRSFAANGHNARVRIYRDLGRYGAARRALNDARALLDDQSRPTHWGVYYLRGAALYEAAGDHTRSATFARGAIRTFSEISNAELEHRARRFLGRALLAAGDASGALAEFERAAAYYARSSGLEDERVSVDLEVLRARSAQSTDPPNAEALQRLDEAITELSNPDVQSRSWRELAELQLSQVDPTAARVSILKAVSASERTRSDMESALNLATLSRIHLMTGQGRAARSAGARAVAYVSDARSKLQTAFMSNQARAATSKVFLQQMEAVAADSSGDQRDRNLALLDLALRARGTLTSSRQPRGEALIEAKYEIEKAISRRELAGRSMDDAEREASNLAIALALDRYESMLSEPTSADLVDADDLMTYLERPEFRGAATLVYLWGADDGWRFLVQDGSIQAARMPSLADLNPTVDAARAILETPRSRNRQPLRDLGRTLIPELPATVERLTIIADGPLLTIPATTLGEPGGTRWEPLLGRRVVSYLSWPRQETPRSERGAFRNGVSVFAAASPQPYDDGTRNALNVGALLEASRDEALGIRRTLSKLTDVDIHLGSEATKELLLSPQTSSVSALHIASHGVITDDEWEIGGVILSSSNQGTTPSMLTARDLQTATMSPDLVFLNGCHTGSSASIGTSGGTSLVDQFIANGATTVIATHWNVPDRAASQIALAFYEQLANALESGAASALARTQRRAMSAQTERRAGVVHPYYWGSAIAYE